MRSRYGKCPNCKAFNTIKEYRVPEANTRHTGGGGGGGGAGMQAAERWRGRQEEEPLDTMPGAWSGTPSLGQARKTWLGHVRASVPRKYVEVDVNKGDGRRTML